ncbi:MAG: hypothetical protein KKG87_06235 [Elusimicrobia bacterium]|nr:hypothetical protein [Elusimicrobiota bacterium]
MKSLSLNGKWLLTWISQSAIKGKDIRTVEDDKRNWIEASVPGDVHLDLIKAGLIEEPLYAKNAEKCRWIEEKEWWYRKEFSIDKTAKYKRIELVFEGLDTTAEIYLNGEKIGRHNNCFVPYGIDVSEKIQEGVNVLIIKLDCGLLKAKNKPLREYGPKAERRMWIRKPQFTFKWDWAPRLLTCGIWRSVKLVFYEEVAIRNVYLSSFLKKNTAELTIEADLENFLNKEQILNLDISIRNGTRHFQKVLITLKPGLNKIKNKIILNKPLLWWPRPLGNPHLYDFSLKVAKGQQILDEYVCRYGIREIKILQNPLPEGGKSFTFLVNGKKVFCKGANWVPADSIFARVTKEKYRKLIELAEEANFNMLRVWGGGIYEDPYFYELCNEKGIMVWQDFMFACSLYPDNDIEFCREIKRESELAVKELRNHPCLVIWCGNNENDWMFHDKHFGPVRFFYGRKIYHRLLREICKRLDPGRPYWPSSPYGGNHPNSENQGDRHNWDVIKVADYKNYQKDKGKFISEFGVLSCPNKSSLKHYLPQNEHYLGSPSWQFHNNKFEKGTILKAISIFFKDTKKLSLARYIKLSQLLQGEALKFAIESFRRRKYNCSGSLFWMYADCCGGVGWTIIDYYLSPKLSYHYVKKAYEPILVSIKEENDGFSIWLINDTLRELRGELEYGLRELAGKKNQESKRIFTRAAANSSKCVVRINKDGDCANCHYFAKFRVNGKIVSENSLNPALTNLVKFID